MTIRSKNVLIPLGDDFYYIRYDDAMKMFENHEKIQDFLNDRTSEYKAEVHFSNLSNYFEAIWERSKEYYLLFKI